MSSLSLQCDPDSAQWKFTAPPQLLDQPASVLAGLPCLDLSQCADPAALLPDTTVTRTGDTATLACSEQGH